MARSDTSRVAASMSSTTTRNTARNSDIRVVPVKVLYTINQATHYCLARHMPVAVKIVTPSKQTGKVNRDPKRDSQDSKPGPSSSHVMRNQSAANGTTGSLTNNDWANIDPALRELDASQPPSEEVEEEPGQLYGHVALKSCANAIWAASPDLAYDRTRDWSVYALDPLEEVPMPTHAATSSSSEPTQRGVMTGMGLISHAFAEADGTNNPLSVTGKIIEDNGNDSLEVVLRLQETVLVPQFQMPIPGHPHYAAWASYAQAQAQMAMYPYGQPSKVLPSAQGLGPRTASAPPPSSKSNSSRKNSMEPSSNRTTKTDRSSSKGPPGPFDPNERYGRAFTRQPLVRTHSQAPYPPYYYPIPQQAQAQAPIPSITSRAVEAVGQEKLTSLLKRLASVEGGEVPDPESEEGKAFDKLITLLRSSVQGAVSGPSPLPPSSQPSAISDEESQGSSSDIEELPAPPPPKPAPTTVRKLRLTLNSAAGSPASHASSSAPSGSMSSSTRAVGKQKTRVEQQKEKVQPLKTGAIGNRKPTLASSTNSKDDGKTPMKGKGKTKAVSGGNGGKKRALEAIEAASATQGQTRKKKKFNNGSSQPPTSSDDHSFGKKASKVANTSVPEKIVPLDNAASFEFPTSSADILGVIFSSPKRPPTKSGPRTPPPNSLYKAGLTLKTPKPATTHLANVFSIPGAPLNLTSPLRCPTEPGDDSLFGSPAKRGPFSPFKPPSTRHTQADQDAALPSEDVYRPSSPCERRLGGNSNTFDVSQISTRGPNHWSKDLPPSSPPPPSSPSAAETCRPLPEEDEVHAEYDTIESSPTKVLARIFGDLEQNHTNESSPTRVVSKIFGNLETPRAPDFKSKSYPGTDTEEDNLFGQLHDPSLDDIFASFWSDGTLSGNAIAGSSGSESETFHFGFDDADFQVGGMSTPAYESGGLTDLDLDYDELLKWCGGENAAAGGRAGWGTSPGGFSGPSAQDVDDLLGLTQQGTTAGSSGVSADERLKGLLGGCLV